MLRRKGDGLNSSGTTIAKRGRAKALVAATAAAAMLAIGLGEAQAATANLPRRTIPLPLHGTTLPVPVGGEVTYSAGDPAAVDGNLVADLAGAQQQATAVLAALLNRDDRCGDRLTVKDGRLGARDRALRVTGVVDYGRVACVGGRSMTVVPQTAYDVDMLLHPVVAARSLRVRAEVLGLRPHGGGELPGSLDGAMRQTLGGLVSERVGELFPAGSAPADVVLRSLSFDEAASGALSARLEGSGSLPRPLLERLLKP